MQLLHLVLLAACAAATPGQEKRPKHCPHDIATCGVTFTAHPTASSSGSVTCASSVATPSSNARLRIEGNDTEGTIFEGCIVAGPREITTASGGTHNCDGTNGGANADPGTVPTDQLDAASKLGEGGSFSYDAVYYDSFDDFFITRIGASAQTADQFWGILVNGQFTPTGGCQFEVGTGDETLFAFDAFSKEALLRVTPGYAVAEAGSGSVTVTVTDTLAGDVVAGAGFGGAYTDAEGHATVSVPTAPGCYELKATKTGALRSNAFYLTVVDSFSSCRK